jgi:hypothetical protein
MLSIWTDQKMKPQFFSAVNRAEGPFLHPDITVYKNKHLPIGGERVGSPIFFLLS